MQSTKGSDSDGSATQKFFKDHIKSLSKNAYMKLAHKAGVKAMAGLCVEELRNVSRNFLENVLRTAIIYTQHTDRRRISRDDVLEATRHLGHQVLAAGDESKLKRCDSFTDKKGKARKSTRGTRALREITFYQKQYDCLYFSRAGFSRLVREISQIDLEKDMHFSSDSLGLLQQILEIYVIKLLDNANLLALHAQRHTVLPKDIQLVIEITEKSHRRI